MSQLTSPAHPETETSVERLANSGAIAAALDTIFQSTPFRASRQCQDLLRYIVTHTVAGDDPLLRERVIGMEVFARRPDYDTGEDPVVRLRASELRKRLAQFYQSDAGRAAPLQISVPAGSYRATFLWQTASAETSVPPVHAAPPASIPAEAATEVLAPRNGPPVVTTYPAMTRLPKFLAWIAVVALLCGAAALFLRLRESRSSAINAFWGPLMDDPHPTLVCMGSNAVYRLSNDFLRDYEVRTGKSHDGIEFLIDPVPGKMMDQRDLLRATNSFVALGDVAAASNFVAFLSKRGKNFTERFPTDMSFAEIQEYSGVLIGGFNNQMALTVAKDLPFVLKGSDRIEDRSNPGHNWKLQFYGDARESEDYALISRLVDPATQHEVVTLGGIGQYGTQAAADFLTDPASMRAWAAGLPKGWSRKNIQVVLHVKIIDYRPIQREVVATKVW